jgi:hypothetical protein
MDAADPELVDQATAAVMLACRIEPAPGSRCRSRLRGRHEVFRVNVRWVTPLGAETVSIS